MTVETSAGLALGTYLLLYLAVYGAYMRLCDARFKLILRAGQPDGSFLEEHVFGEVRTEDRDPDLGDEANWLSPEASKELTEFCDRHGCDSRRATFLTSIVDTCRLADNLERLEISTPNGAITRGKVRL